MTRSNNSTIEPKPESTKLRELSPEARIELLAGLLAECLAEELSSNED